MAVIGDAKEFMADTRVSLIERVRNQDDSVAWGEFFDIYRPLLVAYVRKRGVSEHDAADVVQEVFSRLVPALGHFEFDAQRGRFRTWLWRVTHNALADWGRRRAVRARAEQEWAEQERTEQGSVDQHQPAVERVGREGVGGRRIVGFARNGYTVRLYGVSGNSQSYRCHCKSCHSSFRFHRRDA